MAQEAGVIDVHAAYGTAHTKEEYELLVKVTHWTDTDVTREQELKAHEVEAHTTLKKHFDELLDKFEFVPLKGSSSTSGDEWENNQIEIWKKTVDVQPHFNDIEMKIRNLAMTFVVALVGAVGLIFKEKITLGTGTDTASLPAMFLLAGVVIWMFFWFMDRHWYHRLLYGSVRQGMLIEKRLEERGYQASLTDSIGEERPVYVAGRKMRSPNKIDLFYFSLGALLLSSGVLFLNTLVGFGVLISCIGGLIGMFLAFERGTRRQA